MKFDDISTNNSKQKRFNNIEHRPIPSILMLDKGSDNDKISFIFYIEDFSSQVFDMRVQKICKFLFKVLHGDGNEKKK